MQGRGGLNTVRTVQRVARYDVVTRGEQPEQRARDGAQTGARAVGGLGPLDRGDLLAEREDRRVVVADW